MKRRDFLLTSLGAGLVLGAPSAFADFIGSPYFKDAEDVYAYLGRLFEDIIADEELGQRFKGADTIIQIRMRRLAQAAAAAL